jgi:hypothetical protein
MRRRKQPTWSDGSENGRPQPRNQRSKNAPKEVKIQRPEENSKNKGKNEFLT